MRSKPQTSELTLAEKRVLLEALENDISAATSAVDAPKKRLAAVSAAAKSTNQRTKEAYRIAVSGLQALGMKIDAIAASGDISQLDKLMKEQGWSTNRKIQLKLSLGIVGAF
jgi:hypothetical protein